MFLSGSTQPYLKSIDTYETFAGLDGARVALNESDYGAVAVQFDGAQLFGQRTFCFSYALAGLQDGEGLSTRNELLKRILDFFEVTVGVEEQLIDNSMGSINVYPNPASDRLNLEFLLERDSEIAIEIFDLSGRKVSESAHQFNKGNQQIQFNVNGYATGVYYVRIQAGEHVETIKWVKAN